VQACFLPGSLCRFGGRHKACAVGVRLCVRDAAASRNEAEIGLFSGPETS